MSAVPADFIPSLLSTRALGVAGLLDELVPTMVKEQVQEVMHELDLEQTANELIDELARTEVEATIDTEFPIIREEFEKRQECEEEALIKTMSCRVVTESMMLRRLVDSLARSGEHVQLKQSFDFFLKRQILKRLLSTIRAAEHCKTQVTSFKVANNGSDNLSSSSFPTMHK